jgi:hypothetical protein
MRQVAMWQTYERPESVHQLPRARTLNKEFCEVELADELFAFKKHGKLTDAEVCEAYLELSLQAKDGI